MPVQVLENPIVTYDELAPMILETKSFFEWTDERLIRFSAINPSWQIELNKQGELEIMPPTGWDSGEKNASLVVELGIWAKKTKFGKTGIVFESSTGFRLPNGAVRSPDAFWVRKERLAMFDKEARKKFVPLCPDFAIELMSESDSLRKTQEKMQEYLENGLQLGWLINPKTRQVFIYLPEKEVEILENPNEISGEPLLEGFTLNLEEIWESDK